MELKNEFISELNKKVNELNTHSLSKDSKRKLTKVIKRSIRNIKEAKEIESLLLVITIEIQNLSNISKGRVPIELGAFKKWIDTSSYISQVVNILNDFYNRILATL